MSSKRMPPETAGLLRQRGGFIRRAVDALDAAGADFPCAFRRAGGDVSPGRAAAGVLLPLCYLPDPAKDGEEQGRWVLRLIKRSSRTVQGGDISAPGGMLHPAWDPLLRIFFAGAFSPFCRSEGCRRARRRGALSWKIVSLLWTTALREAWEEIGLAPWNVAFLGPLPPHSLVMFRKTIFPLCGWVMHPRPSRPNREVARVVEIPLEQFLEPSRFGRLVIDTTDDRARPDYYPCLVTGDGEDRDILWGATFRVVTGFLGSVLHYTLPDLSGAPVIRKTIDAGYLTGNRRDRSGLSP